MSALLLPSLVDHTPVLLTLKEVRTCTTSSGYFLSITKCGCQTNHGRGGVSHPQNIRTPPYKMEGEQSIPWHQKVFFKWRDWSADTRIQWHQNHKSAKRHFKLPSNSLVPSNGMQMKTRRNSERLSWVVSRSKRKEKFVCRIFNILSDTSLQWHGEPKNPLKFNRKWRHRRNQSTPLVPSNPRFKPLLWQVLKKTRIYRNWEVFVDTKVAAYLCSSLKKSRVVLTSKHGTIPMETSNFKPDTPQKKRTCREEGVASFEVAVARNARHLSCHESIFSCNAGFKTRIQDFDQGGGGVLTPGWPWAQNLLRIAWQLHDFGKILGAKGSGPPGPPGSASARDPGLRSGSFQALIFHVWPGWGGGLTSVVIPKYAHCSFFHTK